MRRYIRHPFKAPIEYCLADGAVTQDELMNFSAGGLCFHTELPLQTGSRIQLCIPIQKPPFKAEGIVAWCHSRAQGFSIGVRFPADVSRFALRMVEQICHIEQYRREQQEKQGTQISTEQAAAEWIDRYAEKFPS